MVNVANPKGDTQAMARLRLALHRELAADEAVLWHGWQLGRLEPQAFGLYLFAIPWTAFSVMWTAIAFGAMAQSGDGGPGWIGWAFPLFGLPFVGVGMAMRARPFVPWFQHGRVLYVISTRRALKLGMGRELVVKAAPAERIGLVQRFEKRDGSGRLQVAIKGGKDSDGDHKIEYFEIGLVADIMDAHTAINGLAQSHPRPRGSTFELPA